MCQKALVIVDMQPWFPSAVSRTLVSRVLEKITEAKLLGEPIVVLEYAGKGPTDWRIFKALRKYTLYRHATKTDADGSCEVVRVLEDFSIDCYVVCGVQTGCCVLATAEGLSHHGEVRVALDACRDRGNKFALNQLRCSQHNLVLEGLESALT